MKLNRRTFLVGTAGLAINPLRFIQDRPTAKVQQGVLQGYTENGINIFKGIPFAAPPTGDLRFKLAMPPQNWTGTRDAIKNAPAAMQSGQGDSEDCLYLNVFAPQEPGDYPVLFWIHGGGNTGGSTNGQTSGDFTKNGIIVVTVAYRLGAFGYLPLKHLLGDDYASSGVNGIQDLVAALNWVKTNIAAFGGDPNRVTIAGQSAGAKNVAAIMATPNAKGLFSRAIMHSGSGQTVHIPEAGQAVTNQLLQDGLSLQTTEALQLKNLKAAALLDAQRTFQGKYTGNYPFRPTVGSEFLTDIPERDIQSKIPLLLGTCLDESIAFMDRNQPKAAIRSTEIANIPFSRIEILEERYKATFPDFSDLKRRIRLVTAEEYWMPSVRFAEAHSTSGAKTWMYRFDHLNSDGFAPHGAEMAYTWKHNPGWTLHETWVDFIKGKSPKDWPLYNITDRKTLIFGQDGKTSVTSDPSSKERMLWKILI